MLVAQFLNCDPGHARSETNEKSQWFGIHASLRHRSRTQLLISHTIEIYIRIRAYHAYVVVYIVYIVVYNSLCYERFKLIRWNLVQLLRYS